MQLAQQRIPLVIFDIINGIFFTGFLLIANEYIHG